MTIPANIRVPFFYLEFDPSKAVRGPQLLGYKALLMGQKLSGGTKDELEVFRIQSADMAAQYGGVGSQAHRIAIQWFANNKTTETYMILIDDEGAAAAAEGTITASGTATADGTIHLLINGVSIQVGVLIDDTATVVGDAIEAAINAVTKLPVTAANSTGTVTLTAQNKGEVGNYFDVQDSFYDGQVVPAGITLEHVLPTGGTGVVDIDEIIGVLGEEWYNAFVCPWTDAANLIKLQAELVSRFGSTRMIDGVAGISVRGTPGTLSSFSSGKNYQHITCIHSQKIPNSPEEFTSMYVAQWCLEGEKDPARPFQTVALLGAIAPKIADQFDWDDNNGLLYDGISTWSVDAGGVVRIQRCITMYQVNAFDAADTSYLNLTTMLSLMYMRYGMRTTFLIKYPRAKLADDNQRLPSGQSIVTPSSAKAEIINIFKGWQEILGIAENIDQFKTDLIVERNVSDRDRLDILMSPDLINQLRVLTGIIQFLL